MNDDDPDAADMHPTPEEDAEEAMIDDLNRADKADWMDGL